MTTNYSRVTVFTYDGRYIAELQTRCRRTWVQADIGTATFWLSPKDPKYSDDLLKIGNLVMIEHDTLPIWGGEIVAPQSYDEGQIEVNAQAGEGIAKSRIMPRRMVYEGGPAAMVRAVINDCNSEGDTRYREYDLYDLPITRRVSGDLKPAYEVLDNIVGRFGGQWWVDPALDANDRLQFNVSCTQDRGTFYSDHPCLLEGQNIEAGRRPIMVIEQNPINDAISVNRSIADGGTMIGRARDEDSIVSYGLRQILVDSQAIDRDTADAEATNFLNSNKRGARLFNVIAANRLDLFSFLRIGNTLPLQLNSVGFTDGRPGINTYARIIGIAYDDTENTAPLTLQEVIV